MRLTGIIFLYFFLLLSLLEAPLWAQAVPAPESRSFNEIFPGITPAVRQAVFSNEGYSKSGEKVSRSSLVGSAGDIDAQIIDGVLQRNPFFR